MTFEVAPLPFEYDALEPHITKRNLELHHGVHHPAYVGKLNAALEGHADLQARSIEDLIANLNSLPEAVRTAVRNNGGGHLNHTLMWEIMGPNAGGEPTGELADKINATFGDFATFKQKFEAAGAAQFGSGWVYLTMDGSGNLAIETTGNQDCPVTEGRHVIVINDVWEHAYYPTYENRRPAYLEAFWNVVDWSKCSAKYEAAKAG